MQRRSSFIRTGASLIMWVAVVCAANACKAPDEVAPATNTSNNSNGPAPGPVNDAAGFSMGLTGKTSHFYIHDSSDTTNFTTPCKVAATAVGAARNIFCTIDAPELDLHILGVNMLFNVPTTMCTYTRWMPYHFYRNLPGTGPTTITYYIDRNGTYGIDANVDGIVDTPNEVLPVGSQATVDLVGGKPTCLYNYTGTTAPFGPNCCSGKYSATVNAWDATANAGAGGYKTTSTADIDWGGKTANCLLGPAVATQTKMDSGFPLADLYLTKDVGVNKQYDVAPPLGKSTYANNVHAANYFEAADHPLRGYPIGFDNQFTPGTMLDLAYYDLQCLDQAREVQARIRLQVRSWHSYAEWQKKGAGNPEYGRGVAEPPPFNTFPVDDVWDWFNYGNFYTGQL